MNFDRRSETRERVKLPVAVRGGGTGFTRDVSMSGLRLEISDRLEAGSTIDLTVSLSDADRPMRLEARGLVLRVEPIARSYGVAVKLLRTKLLSVT